MNDENLLRRIEALEGEMRALKSSYTIPLQVDQALQGRGFVKNAAINLILTLSGIVQVASGALSAIVGLGGTNVFYVSSTSGGPVTTKLTYNNGILTSDV